MGISFAPEDGLHVCAERIRFGFSERMRAYYNHSHSTSSNPDVRILFGNFLNRRYLKFVYENTTFNSFSDAYDQGLDPWWPYYEVNSEGDKTWQWVYGDGVNDSLQHLDNIQSWSFWRRIQQGLQAIATKTCIPEVDYTGETGIGFDGFDNPWLEFCRWAGGELYTSDTDYGWPRIDSDNVVSRGYHEMGDGITPQMILSITRAMDHQFEFTGDIGSQPGDVVRYGEETGATPEEARTNAIDSLTDSTVTNIYEQAGIEFIRGSQCRVSPITSTLYFCGIIEFFHNIMAPPACSGREDLGFIRQGFPFPTPPSVIKPFPDSDLETGIVDLFDVYSTDSLTYTRLASDQPRDSVIEFSEDIAGINEINRRVFKGVYKYNFKYGTKPASADFTNG